MSTLVIPADAAMSATVATKGQVTIPKQLRDYLGLTPGSPVDFDYTPDGQVVIAQSSLPKQRRKSPAASPRCAAP